MDDSIEQHEQHRHRHRIRRQRRKIGLRGEDYFLFALTVIAGALVMTGVLWMLNRPMKWW